VTAGATGRLVLLPRIGRIREDYRILDLQPGPLEKPFREALTTFDAAWHHSQASAAGQAGDWSAAHWHFRRLAGKTSARPAELHVNAWYNCAVAAHAGGDRPACRAIATDLIERFGKTNDPRVANALAWLCGLMPGAVDDPGVAVRLARLAVSINEDNASWQGTLGLALYRAGQHAEARRHLQKAILLSSPWTPEDCFVLAMVEARRKDLESARGWLRRGIDRTEHLARPILLMMGFDGPAPGANWQRRLEWHLWREEAEAVLKEASP
jgi:hypothetical protein